MTVKNEPAHSLRQNLPRLKRVVGLVLMVLGAGLFVAGLGSYNYSMFSLEAAVYMLLSGLCVVFGFLLRFNISLESTRAEGVVAFLASSGIMLSTSALIPYLIVYTEDVLVPEGAKPRFVRYFIHPYLGVSIFMAVLAFVLLISAGYIKYKHT
jgi:hypothetical protein